MLRALEFDGYMQMSISKFRERFLAQTDTPEYQDLLRRLSEHIDLRFLLLSSGDNPDAVFYFDIVENLTGEDWEFRSYEGSAATSFSGENETPMFRYTFSLAVTDPDLLTVEAYDQARIGYHTILDGFLSGLNPGSSLPSPDEDAIRELFVKAVNILLIEKEEILESFCAIKDSLFDLQSLETERSQLQEELNVAAELLRQRVGENARIAPERQELWKRYSGLENRLDNAQERLNEVNQVIAEKQAHRAKIEMFLAGIQKRGDLVTEFDEGLWYSLIEYVAVFDKEDIRFTFKDGTEIKVY